MADLPEIRATYRMHYFGADRCQLDTIDGTGYLKADFLPDSGEFKIMMMSVTTPRRGLGKALLRRAESEARAWQAQKITTAILSAECLVSMTEVFGAENITVNRQGQFGEPRGTTDAKLEFFIVEPFL